MRNTVWLAAGTLLSGLLVVGVGILTIQRIGVNSGALYGLDNQLRSVQGWGPALLHLGALVALPIAVLFIFATLTATLSRIARHCFALAFVFATAAQVFGALAVYAVDFQRAQLEVGFSPWWFGWWEVGAIEPSVIITLVICLWVYRRQSLDRRKHLDTTDPSATSQREDVGRAYSDLPPERSSASGE